MKLSTSSRGANSSQGGGISFDEALLLVLERLNYPWTEMELRRWLEGNGCFAVTGLDLSYWLSWRLRNRSRSSSTLRSIAERQSSRHLDSRPALLVILPFPCAARWPQPPPRCAPVDHLLLRFSSEFEALGVLELFELSVDPLRALLRLRHLPLRARRSSSGSRCAPESPASSSGSRSFL